MSHFGRSRPPAIRDTFSLLVLNVSFRTTADDLFPLFDRYGEVVDIYIPRDRRTGDSRGFAFVRYKYEYEAQKAVDKLDGRAVDGRDIMVQFAKYGPNAERMKPTAHMEIAALQYLRLLFTRATVRAELFMVALLRLTPFSITLVTFYLLVCVCSHKGRIAEEIPKPRGRSRSRSPRRRHRDDYRDRDYRRRSRSRSGDRYEPDRYRDIDYRRRSRSRSISPGYVRKHSRRSRSPAQRSPSRSRSYSPRRTPPSHQGTPSKPRDDRFPRSRSPST